MLEDIRHAVRLLRRSPGHALTALAALSVGLGTTVAIFSAVHTVLLRPLPVPGAGRVVVPVSVNPARGFTRASVPFADYAEWREQRDVFAAVALYRPTAVDVSGDGTPERVQAAIVTEDYFTVLSTAPAGGRVLQPADHAADAPRVAVLAESFWRRRFGADPSLVGRDIRLAGNLVTVVGIVAADRLWPLDLDVWLPLKSATLGEDERTRRDNMIFQSVARLRDGVSLDEGRTRVRDIAARVAVEHASSRQGWSTELLPLRDALVEPDLRLALLVLMAGAAVVLLIACANLANLLLARGTDRGREIAVRSALGASRTRLIRQLLSETALLAAIGGIGGVLLAHWMVRLIAVGAADMLPLSETIRIDGAALAAAGALTLLTMVLAGLAPALTTSAAGSFQRLRDGRSGAATPGVRRLRDGLVVLEIALSIVLLTAAGLMVRSFSGLLDVDPGVDVHKVLTGRVALPSARYETPAARAQFWERLLADVSGLPGVEAAAAASYVPAGARGFGLGRVFLLDGQPEPPGSTDHPAQWNVVTPDYFRAVGIQLVAGRGFTPRDTAASSPVIIINETMARRVFGGRDPLGARIRSWRDENLLREIVGVVSDVRYAGIADEDQSLVYVPHAQNSWGAMLLVVRTAGDPAALAQPVRQTVARHDPDLAVADVNPLSVAAARSIAAPRFGAWLFGLFSATAALLAGMGIYGVMSYAVARRRHEIAVRLALGATPRGASVLVLRQGMFLTFMGIAIGLAGAVVAARAMRSMLFGVQPDDLATFIVVPVLLGLVALGACALPAVRAARVEPMAALKTE